MWVPSGCCACRLLLTRHHAGTVLQVVKAEQGDDILDNPPDKPAPVPPPSMIASATKSAPYCRAIALSEPVLTVDGDGYWTVVCSGDVLRRLFQLLSAKDSETRLGACMLLSKLIVVSGP